GLGRLARGELAEVRLELVAPGRRRTQLRLALRHHRAQRDVGRIGDAASIARAALLRGIGTQARDLGARGDDVGMGFGPAAGEVLVDLTLELRDLAGGGAAIVAAAAIARNGRRGRREL